MHELDKRSRQIYKTLHPKLQRIIDEVRRVIGEALKDEALVALVEMKK